MTSLEELQLDDHKKLAVENLILQAQRDAATRATNQAKVDFRAGVAGSRRPNLFDPATTHIATYFDSFEPFRLIMNLDGAEAVNTFLTYLDQKSLDALIANRLVEKTSWSDFRKEAILTLTSPSEAVKARYELKKAKQRPDETVAQFGERLMKLAKLGYTDEERDATLSILKDALTGGLNRDEIAVALINDPDLDFKNALEKAVKLDGAYRARSSLRDEDNIHVAVLKNEIYTDKLASLDGSEKDPANRPRAKATSCQPLCSTNNNENYSGAEGRVVQQNQIYGIEQGSNYHPQQFVNQLSYQNSGQHADPRYAYQAPYANNEGGQVQCYKCYQYGHYATGCPNNFAAQSQPRPNPNARRNTNRGIRCHYCGIYGHFQRDCRKKMRDEGSWNTGGLNGQRWPQQEQWGRPNLTPPRFSEPGNGSLDYFSSQDPSQPGPIINQAGMRPQGSFQSPEYQPGHNNRYQNESFTATDRPAAAGLPVHQLNQHATGNLPFPSNGGPASTIITDQRNPRPQASYPAPRPTPSAVQKN